MWTILAWLHAFHALIVHWSIAAALIAGAVAVYIFVPVQLAKQAAIAVGVGAGIYIFAYTAGDRDGSARVQFQFDTYKTAEKALTDAEIARQKDVGAAKVAVLQQQLDAAQADDDIVAEEIRKLQSALAAKASIVGRGATQEDVDALNH